MKMKNVLCAWGYATCLGVTVLVALLLAWKTELRKRSPLPSSLVDINEWFARNNEIFLGFNIRNNNFDGGDYKDEEDDRGKVNLGTKSVHKLNANMDDPKVLNVHVVPHTHDDVGWLKTVEQYFYGENMTIQHACVEDILDSVISSLLENPFRTFTYVEQKFFSMWWERQDDKLKDTVRYLVSNKQLGFVNGGWCMHDEAATHFMGMIDQTTLGHRFLKRELGVIPKVGWQLDPFGHSATQASLFASKVGFDALYFGRIDYQDLAVRHYTQRCEGLWNSSESLSDTTVFWGLTGSYEGNYGAPSGYCFDVNCDDTMITGLNNTALETSVHEFLTRLRVQSDRTKGNHIMLTMGSDFQYQRAHVNFANLDLLISTIQELQRLDRVDIPALFGPRFDKVNIFYSSPDYYTQCKYEEVNSTSTKKQGLRQKQQNAEPIKLEVKQDDFMPYSDCEHCFWTGYFTSRAALKRLERVSSGYLLASRQIDSMGGNSESCEEELHELEDASGVAQHHDGVSGTSKQHVADDYAQRLQAGINQVTKCNTRTMKQMLLGSNASQYLKDFQYCQLLNETICEPSMRGTESSDTDVYLVVYNGLAQYRSSIIHLPVSSPSMYSVTRLDDVELDTADSKASVELVEAIPSFDATDSSKHHAYRIVFSTGDLSPLGASIFKVSVATSSDRLGTSSESGRPPTRNRRKLDKDDIVASNEYFSATFDRENGRLKTLSTGNLTMEMRNDWGYYTSFDSDFDAVNPNDESSRETQNSGAYIFRPSTPDQSLRSIKQTDYAVYNTTAGMEIHSHFAVPWIKTVTRVMVGQPYLEVEYSIGPIPIDDLRGKEVVSRFGSQIQNEAVFYTDSNGREFMRREVDRRPTWELNVYEPVAGNYYPVNAAIFLEDKEGLALAVATDRSQGGASLHEGSLELMVHRRILDDDARGVDEPMNETDGGITPYPPYGKVHRRGHGIVIRGKHLIRIGSDGGAPLARSMMDSAFVDPLVFAGTSAADDEPPFVASAIDGLDGALPPNVMLVTRAVIYGEESPAILLRLAHQYGIGEDHELSEAVEVDLASCLGGREIDSIVEMTLSANQEYESWSEKRFDWTKAALDVTSDTVLSEEHKSALSSENTRITLNPMDIRTFVVWIK